MAGESGGQNVAGNSREAQAVILGRAVAGDPEARAEVGVMVAQKLDEKDSTSGLRLWEVILFVEPWDWPKYWPKSKH